MTGPYIFDYIKRLIQLTVMPLSGGHCIKKYGRIMQVVTNLCQVGAFQIFNVKAAYESVPSDMIFFPPFLYNSFVLF